MSIRAIAPNPYSLQDPYIPSVLPLIFDRHVIITPSHWVIFLTAGVSIPVLILAATYLFLPHRRDPLPPMEIVLSVQPAPKQLTPKLTEPPEKPKQPSASRITRGNPNPSLKARAGKVLAATPHTPVAQMAENNSIITGESDSYAGGDTTSSGTSEKPIEGVAQAPPPPASITPPVDEVALIRAYLTKVRDLLEKEKHYPLIAQRLGISGVVVVSFVIMADGRFDQVKVVSSSGSDLLDGTAVDAVYALSGKIKRPKATGTIPLRVKTALRFEIAK